MSAIEGAASNLREPLFDTVVGHCVQKYEDGLIDIGKLLTDTRTGKTAEVDVFRIKEDREVWCYECTAHQPTELVDLSAVTHWVKDRISVMHAALCGEHRFQGYKFHYQFWTCGTFAANAVAFWNRLPPRRKDTPSGGRRVPR